MVEYGRFAQIDRLEAEGWFTDEETHRLEMWTYRQGLIGSPTYLKNPSDGLVYACGGGREEPVEGNFPSLGLADGTERDTTYQGGRPIAQG